MKKAKQSKELIFPNTLFDSPRALLIISIAAICFGIFFIYINGNSKSIEREEEISYSGKFESYENSNGSHTIHFKNGVYYTVYPNIESKEFSQRMESLEKGTTLYIKINPDNNYVTEIKTDTEELFNFKTSQTDIYSYNYGYIAIGCTICILGVLLIVYTVGLVNYRKKEDKRHNHKTDIIDGKRTVAIRDADFTVKSRVFLNADVEEYKIVYRRVKSVNELVINGKVYDEKKGIAEYNHKLCAIIDDHYIEAGLQGDYIYISFDEMIIDYKMRRF